MMEDEFYLSDEEEDMEIPVLRPSGGPSQQPAVASEEEIRALLDTLHEKDAVIEDLQQQLSAVSSQEHNPAAMKVIELAKKVLSFSNVFCCFFLILVIHRIETFK